MSWSSMARKIDIDAERCLPSRSKGEIYPIMPREN